MKYTAPAPIFACLALGLLATVVSLPAHAQKPIPVTKANPEAVQSPIPVPNRVLGNIDETKLVTLTGNTNPMARKKYDQGLLDPSKLLERIVLTLKRSPEQEQALHDFNERQYTPGSPDFHHWLEPEEFGRLYGPSDSDITAISSWLQNNGFRVERVSKGKITLEFTGTVEQVQKTFHVEMHKYLVNGEDHIANDRDPKIPAALFPVVTGIFSLHDFFPKPQIVMGPKVRRDMKTGRVRLADPKPDRNTSGAHPELGYEDVNSFVRMDVTPADFAKIYNEDPLFTASTPINGKGVTIAIDGVSDVQTSDFNSFRSAFGLPAQTLKTIIAAGSTDPGFDTAHGGEGENTLDVEWSGATAPGAQIEIVVSSSTSTTPSVLLTPMYIIDNKIAPIMSGSYGGCELGIGTSGNATFNNLWQQGATQGISLFESSGDQGSAGCTSQDTAPPNADSLGLQVNGEASPPYITAVGGTDLNWNWWNDQGTPPAWEKYWATSNGTNRETALGYIPEIPWNSTCTSTILLNDVITNGSGQPFPNAESLCNVAAGVQDYSGLVAIGAGSGGPSHCTTNSSDTSTTLDPSSCSGGYAKPSWQTGIPGIPNDGHRDVPDVALMAAGAFLTQADLPSSSLIYCYDQGGTAGCSYASNTEINAQEVGGTSASAPAMAGIMALIVQSQGGEWQGLANPGLYALARKQTYSNCSSDTNTNASSCYFNDIDQGTIAQVCNAGGFGCVVSTSGDTYGVLPGYSANVGYDMATGLGSLNVANVVNGWSSVAGSPTITLTPTAVTFPGTTVVNTTDATTEVVTVKNTGSAAATFTGFNIGNTSGSSFTGTTNCPNPSLAAGSSCTVTITFKPTQTGTNTGLLTVSDNAGTGSQTASITGTGASAGSPAVTLSPTSIPFGKWNEGVQSSAVVVTLKNTGTATLNITSITFTGTNPTNFVKTASTCTTTLAASASCTISVAFKPTAVQAYAANLAIADNATGTPQLVALTGTGLAPGTTVTLTPASISFGKWSVGSQSTAVPVTLKNTGTAVLSITTISFTGTNPTNFLKTAATTCASTLAAGASCIIDVAFHPTSAAAFSADLSIADNATGTPQLVTLAGTGVVPLVPVIALNATALTFPNTVTGTTSDAQVVTVSNTGGAAATITSILLGGTNPTGFELLDGCGTTLAAATSCSFYVAFKPFSAAAFTATVSVTDSASGSPQKVTLSGTGTADPVIKFSAATLAFPTTTHLTTSAPLAVTITNSGTSAVELASITITGTNPTDFTEINTCGTSLAAAASCTVYVAFTPAAVASYTAKLSVADGGVSSPQTVTLTGTGK